MLLINPSVRLDQVFSKTVLIALRRIIVSPLKSRHVYTVLVMVWLSGPECYSSQFLLLCYQGNFQHSCLFFPGGFYYLLSNFWTVIYCWSSVMVHT